MNEFDEIRKLVEASKFDGYKAAFLGAMAGWEKSMHLAVRYIEHVTGTGGDSVEHYWKNDCEVCIEIAKFIQDWKPANSRPDSRGAVEQSFAADVLPCGHSAGIEFGESSWSCVVCGHPARR